MRISTICIERPVLATVLSLVIVLVGALGMLRTTNRELPDVDSPVVSVTTVYTGASPEVIERSITQPLEQEIIGIEGISLTFLRSGLLVLLSRDSKAARPLVRFLSCTRWRRWPPSRAQV